MGLWCRTGIHAWGQWKSVYQGPLVDGEKTVGSYETQRRECPKCGRVELRDLRA